jgi:hypothetical protein
MGLLNMRKQLAHFVEQHTFFVGMDDVKKEFLDHLEDAADYYVTCGYSKKEAIKLAIEDFGDMGAIKEDVMEIKACTKVKKVQYVRSCCLIMFLVSFALTFKTSFPNPFYGYIDINPFRLMKVIALISLLLTISTFVWGRKVEKENMCV